MGFEMGLGHERRWGDVAGTCKRDPLAKHILPSRICRWGSDLVNSTEVRYQINLSLQNLQWDKNEPMIGE